MAEAFREDKFFENYAKKRKKEEGIPGFTMNAPMVDRTKKGDIGLELEVEATNALPRDGEIGVVTGKETGAQWVAKADGSLRGNSMEYVVSTPINVGEVKPMVESLFDKFKDHGTKLKNSNRCSTHVHINVGGLTVDKITSIIALWTTFEEALITWCGEARKNNHYSLSSSNSVTLMETWENFLRNGATRFPEGIKYSALNVQTIWTFGSVEYRCGPAADNPDIPIKWSTFLYHFTTEAHKTYANPFDISRDLSELGGYQMLEAICERSGQGEFFKEIVAPYSREEFDSLCLRGFRNAQAIVFGFPWGDWRELIAREYVPQPFGKTKKAKLAGNEWVDVAFAPPPPRRPHLPIRARRLVDDPDALPDPLDEPDAPQEEAPAAPRGPLLTLEDMRPPNRGNEALGRQVISIAERAARGVLRERYGADAVYPNWEWVEVRAQEIDRVLRDHHLA